MDAAAAVAGDKRVDLPLDQPLQPGVQRGIDARIALHQLLRLLAQLFDKVRRDIGHLLRLPQRQRQAEQRCWLASVG